MAKDETEVGITGQPVPKPRTAIQQYKLEKKRRERKHLGKNVGGFSYSSDVNPYLNPRSVREEILVDYLLEEGFASDEKSAQAIAGAMSEEWKDNILGEEKKEFPSDKVRKQSAKHEKNYLTRPNSYSGQASKLKSKKMKAIASTVEVGDDPRNTMHGQDLRKIK